jgi:hypothetical protein
MSKRHLMSLKRRWRAFAMKKVELRKLRLTRGIEWLIAEIHRL